ncbi:MAG: ABC transporter ATP-binding protein [Microbacteriaceae bacterium]
MVRPYAAGWLGAAAAFLVKDSPVWALPPITATIIDLVATGGAAPRIALWGGIALVLLLLNYPFQMVFTRASSEATRSLAFAIRVDLAGRMTRLSLGARNRLTRAVIQTKLVRDVESIELMLAQMFPTVVSAVTSAIGAIVVMALQVPAFLPLFVLAVPLAAGLVTTIRRRAGARNEAFRVELAGLSAKLDEMADLLLVTRGHGLDEVSAASVASRAESVRSAGQQLDILNGRFGAISWISYQVLGLGCLVAAAIAAVTGAIPATAGEVVLLSTYFTLLTNAVTMLMASAPAITRGLDGIRSLGEIAAELDVEDTSGARVERVTGALRLEGVTVRYPGAAQPALDAVDLDIAPGETLALVGASGSGKTTILNAALGFVTPSAGRVLVDGRDVAGLDMRSVRHRMSIVPQETSLLTASVRENVRYGQPELDDATIWAALRDANADEVVRDLPQGLDTVIGPGGLGLSGGQRQRISIARALVRDPRILILDEATSALDPISESLVTAALDRARRGRTTLIVAHRMSTVRIADRVVVLDHGRIVEQGSFDSLGRAGGPFSRLLAASDGAALP